MNSGRSGQERRCEWCVHGKVPDYESYFMTCERKKYITARESSCEHYQREPGADDNKE